MSGWPTDSDRHPFVWRKRAKQSKITHILVPFDLRQCEYLPKPSDVAGGAHGRYTIGKHDARVNAVNRHRPAVAGHVPIQLVECRLFAVREEKADRIGDAVADDDLPIGVGCIGNVDV